MEQVDGSLLGQYSALALKTELASLQHSDGLPTLCMQCLGQQDQTDRLPPPTRTPTCAEWDGVDETPRNLLSSSSVPEREMVCVKNVLLVSSFQEVP